MKLPDELLQHADAVDALRTINRVRWTVMDMIGKQVEQQEGIPFEWFEVLIVLAESSSETVRMRDLASLTLRSKSGMTRLADRMERAGLVRRVSCDSDRRVVLISLTRDGQALIDRITPPAAQIMIERFTSHITPADARLITKMLTRILEANGVELETELHPGFDKASAVSRAAAGAIGS